MHQSKMPYLTLLNKYTNINIILLAKTAKILFQFSTSNTKFIYNELIVPHAKYQIKRNSLPRYEISGSTND